MKFILCKNESQLWWIKILLWKRLDNSFKNDVVAINSQLRRLSVVHALDLHHILRQKSAVPVDQLRWLPLKTWYWPSFNWTRRNFRKYNTHFWKKHITSSLQEKPQSINDNRNGYNILKHPGSLPHWRKSA